MKRACARSNRAVQQPALSLVDFPKANGGVIYLTNEINRQMDAVFVQMSCRPNGGVAPPGDRAEQPGKFTQLC